ncbi:MAG TPA: NADH-quinone oxidoreductase subunit N [candidate division Zixibacteria bacterium]|nr:NADH-quinone oxidoreductase subunit N [candidate division Zixibacteria bacterium]
MNETFWMAPEVIVAITAFVTLIADLFISEEKKRVLPALGLIGLAAGLVATVTLLPGEGSMFGGRFVFTAVAGWFKILFLLGGAFTIAVSWSGARAERLTSSGEYYSVLLFTLVGMMFLVSARDLLTLYISLELATIPLYALASWRRGDRRSGEAGLKYVVNGALASALLLYGLGLLYGLTGQFELGAIRAALTVSPAFWLAAALITAGIGFKLTIVPFHMWAADVYQGAPTPVTAYLSVASKGAGLAFMFQLFFGVFGDQLTEWPWLIALLATITMTLGNLVAIVQNNIKRFMAFSSVSQAGYILLGFLGPFTESVPAMVYYLLVYVFTNMAVFAVIIFYSDTTGRETIDEYRGLSRTNPLVALVMMLGLFSLAGIPPLSGFVGKFFLFSIAAQADLHWLVAVAALNSTVSLFYYLRIVRAMYIEPPFENAGALPVSGLTKVTLAVATIGVIALGLLPQYYEMIFRQTGGWLSLLASR